MTRTFANVQATGGCENTGRGTLTLNKHMIMRWFSGVIAVVVAVMFISVRLSVGSAVVDVSPPVDKSTLLGRSRVVQASSALRRQLMRDEDFQFLDVQPAQPEVVSAHIEELTAARQACGPNEDELSLLAKKAIAENNHAKQACERIKRLLDTTFCPIEEEGNKMFTSQVYLCMGTPKQIQRTMTRELEQFYSSPLPKHIAHREIIPTNYEAMIEFLAHVRYDIPKLVEKIASQDLAGKELGSLLTSLSWKMAQIDADLATVSLAFFDGDTERQIPVNRMDLQDPINSYNTMLSKLTPSEVREYHTLYGEPPSYFLHLRPQLAEHNDCFRLALYHLGLPLGETVSLRLSEKYVKFGAQTKAIVDYVQVLTVALIELREENIFVPLTMLLAEGSKVDAYVMKYERAQHANTPDKFANLQKALTLQLGIMTESSNRDDHDKEGNDNQQNEYNELLPFVIVRLCKLYSILHNLYMYMVYTYMYMVYIWYIHICLYVYRLVVYRVNNLNLQEHYMLLLCIMLSTATIPYCNKMLMIMLRLLHRIRTCT
eukprot:GHVQ01034161.1.p1 GENE.GHVQ01034161.1~~GHVQ01034161.1.p1  ORF type:complete len:544 (+),score=50.96 GHVQ01034161.1:92-1723(+)